MSNVHSEEIRYKCGLGCVEYGVCPGHTMKLILRCSSDTLDLIEDGKTVVKDAEWLSAMEEAIKSLPWNQK